MSAHLNLNVKAPAKLARLREIAAKNNTTWRAAFNRQVALVSAQGILDNPFRVFPAFNHPSKDAHSRGARWIEKPSNCGLRLVDYADKIVRLNQQGWYCDDFQQDVFRGVVYQLPSHKGQERFTFGYADPWNDGPAYLSFDLTDNKEDAARQADRFAEICAEHEQEFQRKESAKLRLEEIKSERSDLFAELKRLKAEIREACEAISTKPAIVETLRAKIAAIRAERRALAEEARTLSEAM